MATITIPRSEREAIEAEARRHAEARARLTPEERRRADQDWRLTVARGVARAALAVVRDETRDEWERAGYAASALETIAGHRTAA